MAVRRIRLCYFRFHESEQGCAGGDQDIFMMRMMGLKGW